MKRFYLLSLMVASLFFIACGDSSEVDNNEPTPNPPTPPVEVKVDKPAAVTSMDGNERVKICWEVDPTSTVTKTIIYVGGSNSYKEYPFNPNGESGMQECEAIIEDLDEGDHTFQIANRDKDGNESEKVSVSAKAYGENYIAELVSRPIAEAMLIKKERTLTITWEADWDGGIGTEVRNLALDESAEPTWVENSEETTVITAVEEGDEMSIQTLYQPANCFDVLYAEAYTITPEVQIIPVADPVDVKSMDGYKRVKIMWSVDVESTVAKSVIYWDNMEASKEFTFSRTQESGMQQCEVIIDGLNEGDHTFELRNYDEDGLQSNAVTVEAKAYGENYVASLTTRTIKEFEYDKKAKSTTIEWDEWSNGLNTEVSYTPSGAEQATTITVANDESTTEISPIDEGADINIQTLYQPENCMDVMRSKMITINPQAEVIPVADPADLKSMDGYERVKLMWTISAESTVKKTVIYWNDKKSYKEVEFKPEGTGVQQCEIILEDLEEGDYTFELVNFDEEGAQSNTATVEAKAYGEKYAATLKTRTYSDESYDPKSETETIRWNSWSKGIETELSYQSTVLTVKHSDLVTNLSPIDEGVTISIQTIYQPDNCMDKIRSQVAYITTKIVVVEVAAPTNLSAQDGKERVKVMWKNEGSSTVKKSIVYWNNKQESRELKFANSGQPGLHQCEMVIDNLAEGNYTFEIVNLDVDGNTSTTKSISARAYGANYISQLQTRAVNKITHDNNTKVATLTLESWSQGDKSVIEYPHATTGSTVRVDVNNSTTTVTLNNIAAEKTFTIYTLYTPTNCMDQMQSAKKSYSTPAAPSQPAGSTLEIKVMQLNVATGNALTALVGVSHMWSDRCAKMVSMIKDNNIDIIGLQELRDAPNGYYSNIISNLGSSYSGVCYSRGYDREGLAIVYRKDKFELVSEGRYWLNMTDPDRELKLENGGYAANFYRIAVYAILREKSTGQEFYFTTAHLDNNDAGNGQVKTWQAQILINHTNARSGYDNGANRFLIVTGDMNSNPEREAIQRFTSSTQNYKDTWTVAENRYRPASDIPRSTMVDIDGNNATQNYACFDYIFVKGGNPRVVSHTIHEAKSGNIIMSDHNAVSAVLQYQIKK